MNFVRRLPYEILNYIAFLLFATFLVSLQSSLWLQLFGFFPAPYLWMPVLCYWAITKEWTRGFLMTYLLCLVLYTFTGLSLEIVFASVITLYIILYLLRDRILLRGNTYFSLACFASTLVHPIFILVSSFFFDEQPIRQFLFFDWILSPLLTALVALPMHSILTSLDRITFGVNQENTEAEFL